jgi:hypothetical protein
MSDGSASAGAQRVVDEDDERVDVDRIAARHPQRQAVEGDQGEVEQRLHLDVRAQPAVGVLGLAYFRYDADAHVLGYIFGAFGLGALCGALVAQQLARTADLSRLAAPAIVAMPLPLFLLILPLRWPVAVLVVGAVGFFAPLVNAPIIGMLTVRTPEALRPKVMTLLPRPPRGAHARRPRVRGDPPPRPRGGRCALDPDVAPG